MTRKSSVSSRARAAVLAGTGALAAAAALVPAAIAPTAASAGSLAQVRGARPGPAILYERQPVAPELQNTGVWKAAPILVSGAEAYRQGEFLYQDFLYDDH